MSAIARQQKTKAEHFCNEANAKLNKGGWFANKERKNEEAAEFFDKAGNAYKVGGFYFEGGEAYQKAADIYEKKLENSFEASKALQNAGMIWIEQVDVSIIHVLLVVPLIFITLFPFSYPSFSYCNHHVHLYTFTLTIYPSSIMF